MNRRRFLQSTALLAAPALLPAPTLLPAAEAERKHVPWLAEVQTPPEKLPQDAPRLPALLIDSQGRAIATREAWEKRRGEIRAAWLEFLGPLEIDRRRPPAWEVLEQDRFEGVIRRRIRYEVEPGEPVEAWLLAPDREGGGRPGVVVFHSTVPHSLHQPAGVKGVPEKAFGLMLAKRGYVCLCPRNYLWPENERIDAHGEAARFQERHPKTKGMTRMLVDGLRAADLLAAIPEVDPARLGCVGHSLGAKEALYQAAFDERMRVSVSSEGGVGIGFSNWHDRWYLGPEVREANFPREHHELLALAAPRAFLLLGGDSADGDRSWPFLEAALPVYQLYGDTPRLGNFNHRGGHAVPPIAVERILAWFEAYL